MEERAIATGDVETGVADTTADPATPPSNQVDSQPGSSVAWSELISKEDLLTEVAEVRGRLQQQMGELESYNGHYRQVRVDAAVLAVLAGIVELGGFDVPWRRHAIHIRDVAGQLSSEANGLGPRNYTPAHASFLNLEPLFEGRPPRVQGPDANPVRDMPWTNVADLSKLMQRMNTALEIRIREPTADRSQWRKVKQEVMHEASVLAVLGEVISTSYDGSEDGEYRQYAAALKRAALGLREATDRGDYETASQRIAALSRSCKDCHDDYRFADDF